VAAALVPTVAGVLTPAPTPAAPAGAAAPGAPAPGAAPIPGGRQGGRGAAAAAAAHVPAHLIRVTAQSDGTFVVTNTRNGFRKTYAPRD
jgi:hypothetical protein